MEILSAAVSNRPQPNGNVNQKQSRDEFSVATKIAAAGITGRRVIEKLIEKIVTGRMEYLNAAAGSQDYEKFLSFAK